MKFGLREIALGGSLALGCFVEQKTEPSVSPQVKIDPVQSQCQNIAKQARQTATSLFQGLEWSSSSAVLFPIHTAIRAEQECLAKEGYKK